MAYKVFTNGSVLNASEINDNLMNQAIAVFSNSSARSAAITSPIEGQVTYLEDTAAYESFDGSSWIGFGGSDPALVLLNTTTFSGVSSQVVDSVFTSTYDNYKIIMTYSASATAGILYYLRASGVDTTTNYQRQLTVSNGSSISAARSLDNEIGVCSTITLANTLEIDLFNPNKAQNTPASSKAIRDLNLTGVQVFDYGLLQTSNTQFDGIKIYPTTGTITGTVSIYGVTK